MWLNVLGILVLSWNAIGIEVSQALTEDSPQQRTCGVTVALTLCDNGDISVIAGDDEKLSSSRKEFKLSRKNISRQIEQTLVLLKSILITSKFSATLKQNSSCVEVIVVSESKEYFDVIQKQIYVVEKWDSSFTQFLKLTFVKASYPAGTEWMRNLFAPCATLRLFLPDILMNYDSLIYLDTDVIILGSIHELWKEFNTFSKSAINGLAPCIPGGKSVNSGVILMNLTRMREVQWTRRIIVVAQQNSKQLYLPDQTILYIYFRKNRQKIHYLSCHWNFRDKQCRRRGYFTDKRLVANGISVLHGSALTFTRFGGLPLFQAVYKKFQQVQLNSEFSLVNFVQNLENGTKQATLRQRRNPCNKFRGFMLTQLEQMLQNREFKIASPQKNDFECDEASVKDSEMSDHCRRDS